MTELALQVTKLSKRYRLGRVGATTLREDVARAWARFRGQPDPTQRIATGHSDETEAPARDDYLWALRDVSFDLKPGDVTGVIGRNGAGKSTLLKLLSRITAPTEGEIRLNGRVGSLLEVGTGFHPELTGRENVYLNGAILGMRRREIRRKYDEIVDFAELRPYMGTPVKRYSSGMYVRLAFAVAAHLEPDILLVDEVLAVGDREFQRKCLGKMDEVARHGRTVLFVSHNMGAVQRLCTSCLLLDKGQLRAQGDVESTVDQYLGLGHDECVSWQRKQPAAGKAGLEQIALVDEEGQPLRTINTRRKVRVQIDYSLAETVKDLQLSVGVTDALGMPVFTSRPAERDMALPHTPGTHRAIMSLPKDTLLSKPYGLFVCLWEPGYGQHDYVSDLHFTVQADPAGEPDAGGLASKGLIAVPCTWTLEPGP